jgi:chlorophyllide a reductase subunit X
MAPPDLVIGHGIVGRLTARLIIAMGNPAPTCLGNQSRPTRRRERIRSHHGRSLRGPKKDTQIIAIYGKGGIGKSFTLANLSYMMAQQGKKVLLIGCDPKSDTTSLLFGGKACPTIIETSTKKKARRRGGQDRRCLLQARRRLRDGARRSRSRPRLRRSRHHPRLRTLEKLGFHDWDFDYVLLDFLGDVVCGGFGLPIARDMCQKVIVVGSNDLQSLYVANNVCSAVEYFRKLGGNVGVAGMVINKDDGSGEAQAFAEAVGIPVLAAIPQDDDIRKKSANYQIIGHPTMWGPLFADTGQNLGRSAAGAARAARPGRPARPVRFKRYRRGLRAGPGAARRHVRPPPWRESRPSKSSTTTV